MPKVSVARSEVRGRACRRIMFAVSMCVCSSQMDVCVCVGGQLEPERAAAVIVDNPVVLTDTQMEAWSHAWAHYPGMRSWAPFTAVQISHEPPPPLLTGMFPSPLTGRGRSPGLKVEVSPPGFISEAHSGVLIMKLLISK